MDTMSDTAVLSADAREERMKALVSVIELLRPVVQQDGGDLALMSADVETPMLRYQAETFGGGDPEGYRRRLRENYPQGARARFLRPEEVADLIFYLAQPAAAGITGANVAIDFGLSAGV